MKNSDLLKDTTSTLDSPAVEHEERRHAPRARFLRPTLSVKFILLMATLLSLALGVESVLNYRYQKSLLLQSVNEKAKVQGKFISEISKEAILGKDFEALNNFMEEVTRIDDISYGAILSDNGQYLTSFLDPNDRAVSAARHMNPQADYALLIKTIQRDPHVITTTHAIRLGNKHVADFVIGADTRRIDSLAYGELMRQLANHAAVVLMLGAVIYFAFRNSMLARIKALIAGASRVSHGKLDELVAVRSNDELCDLTHSFNRMMGQLRESNQRTQEAMDALQDLNQTLESRVQERTARLVLALRIAQMGHWDYDATEGAFQVSAQVLALLKRNPNKAINRITLLRAVHPEDRRRVWQAFSDAINKGRPLEIEFRVLNGVDTPHTLFTCAERLMNQAGGDIRLFGIAQDISARVQVEKAAQDALRETLEARSASEAKSAFLANMSHEIRTPLTAIIGFAETLREPNQTAAGQLEAINTIVDSGKHLLQVINEILDVSKIESGRLTVERLPTRLTDLMADVESVVMLLARAKGLSLSLAYDFPVPAVIQTDPTRLKQILLNLCGNAIKFTSAGGVRIHVRHDAACGLMHFDIADTGIGIAADKIANLFTPFVQADNSTTRRFGGTGLGLYISKQLAEMLGGAITMKSTEGLGTLASVSIATGEIDPAELIHGLQDVARTGAAATASASDGALTGSVLLAEDNPINQRLISHHLLRAGAHLDVADNGQIAYDKAHSHPYDLILMDMQMPLLDGLSATRRLRAEGYAGPIVALTANAFKEDRDNARAAGCNDFLTKPIDQAEFQRVLKLFLHPVKAEEQKTPAEMAYDDDMRDLLVRFIDELPAWKDKLQAAHSAGKMPELRMLAHQLKGLGGSFGYPEISRHAGDVESCIRQHRHDDVDHPFWQLCGACEAAVAGFQERHSIKA